MDGRTLSGIRIDGTRGLMSPYFIQRMVLPKIWRAKDKTRLLGAFEKETMHANRDDGQWT